MGLAIEAKGVGKKFRVLHEKQSIIRDVIPNLFRLKEYEEFWALKDIGFALKQGQTLGIIGRNGSGKSTLLKVLGGITPPTEGKVDMNGRISTLIELGAGFQQELTGIENIFLNATILGLRRKEIDEKMGKIIEFAELGDFINTQVKVYSSGMYVRLGFAIAIHVDFDILLIDEILAVGDVLFQEKCMERIKAFRREGKTIVIVSHSLQTLEDLCEQCICLDRGRIEMTGSTPKVIDYYRDQICSQELRETGAQGKMVVQEEGALNSKYNSSEVDAQFREGELQPEEKRILKFRGTRYGSREIEMTEVRLLDGDGKPKMKFTTGEKMIVEINFRAKKRIEKPTFGIGIYSQEGIYLFGPNTRFSKYPIDFLEGEGKIEYNLDSLPLLEGNYWLSVSVHDWDFSYHYDYHDQLYQFHVESDRREAVYGRLTTEGKWNIRRLSGDNRE